MTLVPSVRTLPAVALLAVALALLSPSVGAADGSPYPAVQELLETTRTVAGESIAYPASPASIRAIIVSLPPGERAARHNHHGTPLFVYVLQGEVEVAYEGIGTRTYRTGEAFMEAMEPFHQAKAVGSVPVRLLAVFLQTATPAPPAGDAKK